MLRQCLPLGIYVAYTAFVLIALVFGPVAYVSMDYMLVTQFVLAVVFLFAVGYILSAIFYKAPPSIRANNLSNFLLIYKALLVASFLIGLVSWAELLSSGRSLSFSAMGENYVGQYDGYVRGQAVISVGYILNVFSQAVVSFTLLLVFSHFYLLSKSWRLIAIFVVLSYLLVNVVGSGKQKYLGDFVVFSCFSFLIWFANKGIKVRLRHILLIVPLVISVFCAFSYLLLLRYQAVNIDIHNISEKMHPLMYWRDDGLLTQYLGDDLGFSLGMFLGYFTNGLYGLNLSLSMDFEWTYFVGSSYSVAKVIEFIFATDILSHSYPLRAGDLGWGLDKWHSLFSWLASDLTFPGVLALSLVFGVFYGRVWLKGLDNRNPFARPLFLYLSLGLIFSFSNNQLMHSLSGVMVLVVLVFSYIAAPLRVRKLGQ